MERYARNDTRYLKPLADKLTQDLKAKGRLAWHRETCSRLILDSTQNRPADLDAVWRVKGSHLLGRPALAILKELWHWREAEAISANKPPFFVMSHDALVEIAAAALAKRAIDPFLPKHLSERRRAGVVKAIARGYGVSPEQHPKILRSIGRRPSEAERRRFLDLQNKRDQRAAELEIDATLIASRGALSDLAHDWEKHAPELMPWQRELLT
jgi:ribonuclease D